LVDDAGAWKYDRFLLDRVRIDPDGAGRMIPASAQGIDGRAVGGHLQVGERSTRCEPRGCSGSDVDAEHRTVTIIVGGDEH